MQGHRVTPRVTAQQLGVPLIRAQQPEQYADRGGLPGTVRPEESMHLTRLDLQVEVVEGPRPGPKSFTSPEIAIAASTETSSLPCPRCAWPDVSTLSKPRAVLARTGPNATNRRDAGLAGVRSHRTDRARRAVEAVPQVSGPRPPAVAPRVSGCCWARSSTRRCRTAEQECLLAECADYRRSGRPAFVLLARLHVPSQDVGSGEPG